jgi:tRNA 2-selenouridine synthase
MTTTTTTTTDDARTTEGADGDDAARAAFEAIMQDDDRDADGMELFAKLATAPGATTRCDCVEAVEATRKTDARCVLVDVRSPGEYEKGHIPGAVNAPLFDNDERAAVGTVYKNKGRGEALVLGMSYAAPRLDDIVRTVEAACEAAATSSSEGDETKREVRDVYVTCFRGGMRSSCVGWLLRERMPGRRIHVLNGGYKGFRKWVLERCGTESGFPAPRVCMVGGRTGVGKTRALLALRAKGEQIIDLEGLANHAGSAFGWVGRAPQPTSEHYSNLVVCEWHFMDPSKWVFIEDEGPHVGRCSVDPKLFERMRSAPLVLRMVASRELRLQTLVDDYATSELTSDPEWLPTMRESIEKLVKRLGGDRVAVIRDKLEIGDFSAVAEGLLEYYDGLYDKHLMNKRKDRRAARNTTTTNLDTASTANDDTCSIASTSTVSVEEERAGAVVDVHCHPDPDGRIDEDVLVRDILLAVGLFESPIDDRDDPLSPG